MILFISIKKIQNGAVCFTNLKDGSSLEYVQYSFDSVKYTNMCLLH